jgi:hypothetical protein
MIPGIVAFVVAILLHACVAHVSGGTNRFVLFLGSGGLVGSILVAYQLRDATQASIVTLAPILLYAALCELHIVLMAFSLSSISGSIVHRVNREPMTRGDLERHYSPTTIVATRIERLMQAGYVKHRGNELALTTRGRQFVRIFRLFQGVFGHR